MKTLKLCRKCSHELDHMRFSPNATTKDGLQAYCKDCRNTHRRATHDPKKARVYALRRLYRMTVEEYDERLASQGAKCAICSIKPEYALHVDHDHRTGYVRGLLCIGCNRILTAGWDNPNVLRLAIKYLEG